MPYERKWTRRKFIRSSAATAAALPLAAKSLRLHAAGPSSCVFNPEQEEGPYYVDRELLRSDITEGKSVCRCACASRLSMRRLARRYRMPRSILALRCGRSLFGIHESQSGWTRWTGWRAGISRRRPPGPPPNGPNMVRRWSDRGRNATGAATRRWTGRAWWRSDGRRSRRNAAEAAYYG